MSNSAVIRFWTDQKDEHPLGIYLHWGGSEYAKQLAIALNLTRDRWEDPDYATRMAVQSILEHNDISAPDLGAGLFVGTDDRSADNPVLNVNWGSKVVWNDDKRIPFETYISSDWKEMQ